MLTLHLLLFGHRLARESDDIARSLNQEVFDIFTQDLDRTLREMGVGDTSVPKRKKRLVRTYYGQLHSLAPALDADDRNLLRERLAERFFGDGADVTAVAFADYVSSASEMLRAQSLADICRGRVEWPPVHGCRDGSDRHAG